jgi:ribokinase
MIIIFGSINMDMVVPVGKFPAAGETVLSPRYDMLPGGKGANQALAAARVGPKTALVGCVGDDGIGLRMLNGLKRDGVITSGVAQSDLPTGMAVILTNEKGENEIVVVSGANADAKADQIPDEILKSSHVLLLQGETPPQENWTLLERAKKRGVTTILNLAPVVEIPRETLAHIDYLVVNQIEARQIAQALKLDLDEDAAKLARALAQQARLTCIVTLGAQGSLAVTPDGHTIRVPALKIGNVVDTTGAGDAYCGTLAAALYSRKTLTDAMKLASVAGSLACTKRGAQDSFPYIGEIEEKLEQLGPAEQFAAA